MKYLSDPAAVAIGAPAWYALAMLGIALPALAGMQLKSERSGRELPGRLRIYLSTLVLQTSLFALAWMTARASAIDLFPVDEIGLVDLGIGLLALVLGLAPLLAGFSLSSEAGLRRTARVLPQTPGERVAFAVVCAASAIGEEVAYRGLAFMVLAAWFGGFWPAAIAAAAMFGGAHLAHSPRNALAAFALGLRDHLVVGITGSLDIVIAVHFLHDVATAAILDRRTPTCTGPD